VGGRNASRSGDCHCTFKIVGVEFLEFGYDVVEEEAFTCAG